MFRSSKIEKTKFIRSILQLEVAFDGIHGKDRSIGNVFEYKENISEHLIHAPPPPHKDRAVNTGNIFILIFAISDLESFIFVDVLCRDRTEKK